MRRKQRPLEYRNEWHIKGVGFPPGGNDKGAKLLQEARKATAQYRSRRALSRGDGLRKVSNTRVLNVTEQQPKGSLEIHC